MALHKHKARKRPGRADAVMLVVVLLAAIGMVAGPLAYPGTTWRPTSGTPTHTDVYVDGARALGEPYRVRVEYRYEVAGLPYTGTWEGEWPATQSPNALPKEELDRLQEPGYILTVLYDEDNPARSRLHHTGSLMPAWWLRLAGALVLLVLWHLFVIYPRWKLQP